jgi:glutathione S-transferase
MSWSATLGSVVRLGAGYYATHKAKNKPAKRLELYEFEACPFCRKVREALSSYDLDAIVYPCPKGGRFRKVVEERTGKQMFPFLIDPNTNQSMLESSDIIRYLADTYDTNGTPLGVSLGPITVISSSLTSALRTGRGRDARGNIAKQPKELLELWSFEASPWCRLVREVLCELELPYVVHNVAKKGDARAAFVERSGKMQVPYLVDPNTSTSMFESADIIGYLEKTYA